MGDSWATRLLRALLRVYPAEFRERFGCDLEQDFAELLKTRGRAAAWRCALSDLRRALPMTHTHDQRARQRRHAMTLGSEGAMGSLLFDARHSVRALIKTPVFTVVTVLTLALGIGSTAAIFSLVNAALLRPLAYHEPSRLMTVHELLAGTRFPRAEMSPPDFLDLRRLQRSFTDVGAYRTRGYELSGAGPSRRVTVAATSPTLFPILGATPARGRLFTAAEERSPSAVAIVTDGFARNMFPGREAIGETIHLDRQPFTIVGVMPPGFEFPKRGPRVNGVPAEVYTPLWFNPFERTARGMFHTHSVIGRLRDGVTPEQAARDVNALGDTIRANYPAVLQATLTGVQLPITSLEEEVSGAVRRPLLILLGAVSLVLFVACANVANLFLSRAVRRRHEIGVRIALGAGGHRLFQMLLVESAMLTAAGGALGLAVAYGAVRGAATAISTSVPAAAAVTIDARVLAFAMALSMLTAFAFGLAPMLTGLRQHGQDAARGVRTHTASRGRLASALVVSSVAMAFVLLVGSGLLGRTLLAVMSANAGVGELQVLTVDVMLPHAAYNDAVRMRGFYTSLQAKLSALPGVKAAAISSDVPIRGDGERRAVTPDSLPEGAAPIAAAVTWIHGDYFRTYGIPIVRGRNLTTDEHATNRRAAIVSRGFAERAWPGEDPIGKRLLWGIRGGGAAWQTVVGVAADVVDGSLTSEPLLHVYVPYAEVPDAALGAPTAGLLRGLSIAVNADTAPAVVLPLVRSAIASLDPALATSRVTTLDEMMFDLASPQRFSAWLLTAFATGALLLAAIGLYGVLAFNVARRTREIGVRLALGARRGHVLAMVVKQGCVLVGVGLLLGLAGALGAVRLLQSLLHGTGAYDLATFTIVPAVLAAVSLLACYLPARRAAILDPMIVLRSE